MNKGCDFVKRDVGYRTNTVITASVEIIRSSAIAVVVIAAVISIITVITTSLTVVASSVIAGVAERTAGSRADCGNQADKTRINKQNNSGKA